MLQAEDPQQPREDSKCSTDCGEQETFGQHLADYAIAVSAARVPNGNLPRSGGTAHEK
jgi:hypothetical protein